MPEPERAILVRANAKACSTCFAAIVREAEKAANREPPKPIEIEEELPDHDAAPSEESDYDGEFTPRRCPRRLPGYGR